MGKKNRVIASITIHVTENGTYKVIEVAGPLRRDQCSLTWTQTKRIIKEFRAKTEHAANAKKAAECHIGLVTKALQATFPGFMPSRTETLKAACVNALPKSADPTLREMVASILARVEALERMRSTGDVPVTDERHEAIRAYQSTCSARAQALERLLPDLPNRKS